MVISHNLMAMNASRMLGISTNNKSKSTEKLSSGYKINRAADDAAGLAISEKMRRQIRGLAQGSENIVEGINLVQTAEGALGEITDMLHRMHEITVKACNDTNSRTDREYLQQEIDQLLSEIDRTSDTTTYNEICLLKGNPSVTEVLTAGALQEHVDIQKGWAAPVWLTKNCSKNLAKSLYAQGTQDTSAIMRQSVLDKDGNEIPGQSYYYGPKPADPDQLLDGIYKWKGEWSASMQDNYAGKIDFSGLKDMNTAEELFNAILNLAGSSFNVPCGTCDDEYLSVGFTLQNDDFSCVPMGTLNSKQNLLSYTGQFDLKNCYDQVKELCIKHSTDTSLSAQEKRNETKALADQLAKNLRNGSIALLATQTSHFDKTLADGDYSIIVYDFRDEDKVAQSPNIALNFTTERKMSYHTKLLTAAGESQTTRPDLIIACSSLVPDGDFISFGLPDISRETLGLQEYSVCNYKDEASLFYTDSFQKKLDQYHAELKDYNQKYQQYLNDYRVEPKTVTMQSYVPVTHFENGELKISRKSISYSTQVMQRVYNQQPPVPPREPTPGQNDITGSSIEPTYIPADMNKTNAALNKVLKMRSDLGAVQNRLEHAYRNNQNKEENLTAAESQIRDTNMADEMINFSNLNIIQQTGQSVLAQANQSRQGILSLLQ